MLYVFNEKSLTVVVWAKFNSTDPFPWASPPGKCYRKSTQEAQPGEWTHAGAWVMDSVVIESGKMPPQEVQA